MFRSINDPPAPIERMRGKIKIKYSDLSHSEAPLIHEIEIDTKLNTFGVPESGFVVPIEAIVLVLRDCGYKITEPEASNEKTD